MLAKVITKQKCRHLKIQCGKAKTTEGLWFLKPLAKVIKPMLITKKERKRKKKEENWKAYIPVKSFKIKLL